MQKCVLKIDLPDDKAKQKVLKKLSSLPGIDSISMDMKEKKLTIIGDMDPVSVASKLRRYWCTDLIFVGSANAQEEEEEEEKEDTEEEEEEAARAPPPNPALDLAQLYRQYNPHIPTYYRVQSVEENRNACVIC